MMGVKEFLRADHSFDKKEKPLEFRTEVLALLTLLVGIVVLIVGIVGLFQENYLQTTVGFIFAIVMLCCYFLLRISNKNHTSQENQIEAFVLEEAGEEESIDASLEKLKGAHILIVEDNTLNQQLAVDFLNDIGVNVTVANDGKEALDILQIKEFDGILMDCQMPVMDGYEATRRIREQEKFKELPIIALTADTMQEDIEKTLLAGMNDHLMKPINPAKMFETLKKWIKSSSFKEPVMSVIDSKSEELLDFPNIEGIDIEKGLSTTNQNKKLYLKLLKKFITNQSDFTRQFQLAFQTEDMQMAVRIVHTLKGLAGSIGALQLQEAALVLEKAVKDYEERAFIQESFENVVKLLDNLLAELTLKIQNYDFEDTNTDTFQDMDKLNSKLEELRNLIAESDTDAKNLLEELSGFKSNPLCAKYFDAILEKLDDYNFDEALEDLDALLSELKE